MKNNPFAFVLEQLEDKLPEPLKPIQAEAKAVAKRVISEKLSSFNLVSREEFDAQARRLAEAEERAARLEARLASLENQNRP